jgi:hypothetical protein
MLSLCPAVHEDHAHPIHENHQPISVRISAGSVSSTSSTSVTPSTGSLTLGGYAPTVMIGMPGPSTGSLSLEGYAPTGMLASS